MATIFVLKKFVGAEFGVLDAHRFVAGLCVAGCVSFVVVFVYVVLCQQVHFTMFVSPVVVPFFACVLSCISFCFC